MIEANIVKLKNFPLDSGEIADDFDYARPAYVYPYIAKYQGGDPKNPESYCPVEDADAYE